MDAASYVNDDFRAAWEVFCMTENLGCLPFAGGWAEQPAWITTALFALKTEMWQADEEDRALKRREEEDRRKYGR